MIHLELFTRCFDEICASFGKTMNAKHLDSWYAEVENRDPEIFKAACHKLKYGERFPTFAIFRATYIEAKAQHDIGLEVERRGCSMCHNGQLIWERGDYSYVSKCGNCSEAKYPDKFTVNPQELINNPDITLIKPDREGNPMPREAVKELLAHVAETMAEKFSSDADESERSRNIARADELENKNEEIPF